MADTLLRRAAARAAQQDGFLASVLLGYAELEGLDDAALAAELGCDEADLARLLLCRQPTASGPRFRSDVERIAAAFSLDAAVLAAVLRRAAALVALRRDPTASTGWLAAARDREPRDEPESER